MIQSVSAFLASDDPTTSNLTYLNSRMSQSEVSSYAIIVIVAFDTNCQKNTTPVMMSDPVDNDTNCTCLLVVHHLIWQDQRLCHCWY